MNQNKNFSLKIFESIEQDLIIHSKLAGLNIFPNIKWSRRESIYKYASHIAYGAGMFNMMAFAWKFRTDPFQTLIVGAFCFDVGSFMVPSITVYYYKIDYLSLLEWCKQKTMTSPATATTTTIIMIADDKHPPAFKHVNHNHADAALKDSRKIIKLVQIFTLVSFLLAMIGITVVGAFLPNDVYDKFKLPLSYYIIFLEPCTWTSYIINYLQQIWAAVHYTSFGMNYFGIFFIICRFLIAHLNAMIDFVKKINAGLNGNLVDEEKFCFEEWLKLIYKQHVEFNE